MEAFPNRFSTTSIVASCLVAAFFAGCSSGTSDKTSVGGAAGRAIGGVAGTTVAGTSGVAASGAAVVITAGATAGSVAGAAGGISSAGRAGAAGSSSLAGNAGYRTNSPFAALSATVDSSVLRGVSPTGTDTTSIHVGANVTREGSQDGAVELTMTGLPTGTSFVPQTVAPGATSVSIQVKVTSTVIVGGPYAVTLVATSVADTAVSYKLPLTLYIAQSAGSLDSSFGTGGIATVKAIPQGTEATMPQDSARDLLIDEQGRTLVSGTSSGAAGDRGWIVRLAPNGAPDMTFGKEGRLTEFGPSSSVDFLARAGDRLYASASSAPGIGPAFWYVRGMLDSGGTDGAFNAGQDVTVTAPITAILPFKGGLLVARGAPSLINSAGKIDTGFSAPIDLTSVRRFASDVATDKVLVAETNSSGGFRLARLTSTGEYDSTWGQNNEVSITCPIDQGTPNSLTFLGYQRSLDTYVAFATCTSGGFTSSGDASLYSVAPTGDAVIGFGTRGKLLLANPGQAIGAAIQSDGKVLALYSVTGEDARGNEIFTPFLKRFTPTTAIDSSFAQAGTLDLSTTLQGLTPRAIAYDSKAQRLVVVANDPVTGAIRLLRVWL